MILPQILSSPAAPTFLKTLDTSQLPGRHFHIICLKQASIAFSSTSWESTMRLSPEVCQCRSFNQARWDHCSRSAKLFFPLELLMLPSQRSVLVVGEIKLRHNASFSLWCMHCGLLLRSKIFNLTFLPSCASVFPHVCTWHKSSAIFQLYLQNSMCVPRQKKLVLQLSTA